MSKDYQVKYRQMGARGEDLSKILKDWKGTLVKVGCKVDVLEKSDSVSGATADRMRQYFADIHGNIIASFQTLMDMIQATWDMYFTTYTQVIDPFPDTIIIVSYVNSLKKKMNSYCEESEGFDDDVKRLLKRIDDIYSSPYARVVTDTSIYEKNAENIKKLCEAIESHESEYQATVVGDLTEVLGYIKATIDANIAQNAMYKSTYTGDGNGPEYEYMLISSKSLRAYMNGNREAIEKARSGVEKHAEDLKAYDIEMAEREKREKEVQAAKTGVIIVGVIVTAGVTVATGGTGTAFVIASIGTGFATGAAESGVDAWGEQYIENGWEGMDWGKVGRSAFVGGIKGAITSGITAGLGAGFDKLGKVGMIAEAGKSSSFLVKHGSKLGMEVVKGGAGDVINGAVERFITSGSEAWVNDGKSGFDFNKAGHEAFDGDAIAKDLSESITDSLVSYGVEGFMEDKMGVKDIERDSLITGKDVGKKAVIGGTSSLIGGVSKRFVGTYVENRLIGMDSGEAREDAAKEAFKAENIRNDLVSGTIKGATEPFTARAKKQKEYEDETAKVLKELGKMDKASDAEIKEVVQDRIKQEHEDWEKDLEEQKAERKEIENNIREKGTANTDAEIKQLNEMRENGELDIEDDPNEKVRKNVNSGNYASEREILNEMRENGELDDDYDSGSAKAKTDTGSNAAQSDDADAPKAAVSKPAAQSGDDAAAKADPGKKAASAGKQDDGESAKPKKAPTMADAYKLADDPNLFRDNQQGDITYGDTEDGKVAYGSLKYTEDPDRNQYAQRTAGGDDRRPDDHGGHLMAASEGGDPGKKNLVAMNDDLNTGRYKDQEMKEINDLKDGAKVYKYVETYSAEGSERPDTIMGYTITETPDGKREVEMFHTSNESAATLDEWNAIADSMPYDDDIPNAMRDEHYDEIHRILEEEGY